jgi:hypothetical protein
MKIFKTKDQYEGDPITFKGVKYFYILDDMGVGIRRADNLVPQPGDVATLTEYLFEEGFASREDYEC